MSFCRLTPAWMLNQWPSKAVVEKAQPLVYITSGLPPIPSKLVKRVRDGHFVDMAELMPKRLHILDAREDDHAKT